MRKGIRLVAIVVGVLLSSPVFSSGPRTWGKSGTATNTNAQLSVKDSAGTTFSPTAMCFTNSSTTIDFFIDYTDGVATTTDDSSNVKILAGTTTCFSFQQKNVIGPFLIGIITASSTAAYNAFAIAAQ
jgi:hypothetical protein